MNNNCPKCNSLLNFNNDNNSYECEYCRTKYNLKDLDIKKIDNNLDIYICNDCGAEIIADENTSLNYCIYCSNTNISKTKLEETFNPGYLIPFKITKDNAINLLSALRKENLLIPKKFNMKKYINNIRGIYVPYRIYNCDSSGEVNFECDKITIWKSNGYKYTKTDKFTVTRGGNMFFEDMLVNGSKKFDNNIMNSIEPFDYKDVTKYDSSYLSDYIVEKYALPKTKLKKDASAKIKELFIQEMKKDIKGYNNITERDNSINVYNFKSSYILLPVWLLNVKYKNEIYTFAINGQTGKIYGNTPICIKKTIILLVCLFIVIFIILVLLNFLKVML